MKRHFCLLFVLMNMLVFGHSMVNAAGIRLQANNLRCEYRVDPLGIDIVKPRLSWELVSDQRGQLQSAYQIIVASSPEKLKAQKGDLWNSGKVASDETIAVVYDGSMLASYMDCFWAVKVWDKSGKASSWSTPAKWSMGLLKQSDWQAQWIGYDPAETQRSTPDIITKANWIWALENADKGVDPGDSYFRYEFELENGFNVEDAMCYMAADDVFELSVNGKVVLSGSGQTTLRKVNVAGKLKPGKNLFAIKGTNNWDFVNPAGVLFGATIKALDGDVINITSNNKWKANDKEVSSWRSLGFDDSSWGSAFVCGSYEKSSFSRPQSQLLPPVRYLRRDCSLAAKKIKKARAFVTSLGIYELYINGKLISNDYFSPGWTDYAKRIYYRTYDVTSSLQKGDNAIGAMLADGWYAGYVGYSRERNHYGKDLRLLCQLYVEYEDGTTEIVDSDSSWKASLGPILYGDFLQGEYYDARKEMPGWNNIGFDDSNWDAVIVGGNEVSPMVQAAVSEPVIVYEQVKPVSVDEPVDGTYVFDMGQNFAGVVQLKIKGKPGQVVQLRHAERLNVDGTIYTTNLRSAAATDTYICKGDGIEIWQPYFTFHGFQYVEITGLTSRPSLDIITGLAMSSDTPVTGTFKCSDAMVNKIQRNADWTQRMNFIDVPTDCPQRDERLGWTGDAQVYINTAAYHNDVQAFFTKWITDLNDAQRADGQYPMVAPLKVAEGDGGPAWADAGVICPWTIYKMYGDKQIVENSYDNMKLFIDFCKNRCTDQLLPPSSFHCFGDWVNINDDTPREVIFMAYFAYSTDLMSKMAQDLGKESDAIEYRTLFNRIKDSFNKAYVQSDGKIHGDSQCGYVLAIAYDLLDDQMFEKAAGHLVRRVKECGWHLSTGFVGTKDLMLALAKIGRNDVAYRLLHNETFPSWGFSIKNGATSIWERWNGWTPEDGFNDPGMNSFAHYSFGAVCQWIFENIGGIQAGSPGFKHIVLKPQPGGKLTWAETNYRSIRGDIKTSWKIAGNKFSCKVSVPPNTTATIYIPATSVSSVKESGKDASNVSGVSFAGFKDGFAIYDIVSGEYSFVSTIK